MNKASISQRIQALMKKHNLGQRDMAELLGISNTTVFRYIHGESVPTSNKFRVVSGRLAELEALTTVVVPSVKPEPVTAASLPRELRDRFVKARLTTGMSVAAAAEILGCSKTALWEFEKGQHTRISIQDLETYIDLYNTGVTERVVVVDVEDADETKEAKEETRKFVLSIAKTFADKQEIDVVKGQVFVRNFLEFIISEGMSASEVLPLLYD